ncbi:MAG: hypothetical protein GC180_01560 [Bacteroidetes bacterium]|nr:hypothetical protein [Bacteroidota bacterium]
MNFFLRAKHWQLFLLLFVVPLLLFAWAYYEMLLQLIPIEEGDQEQAMEILKTNFSKFLLGGIISYLLLTAWMISIAIGLRPYTPELVRLKTTPFWINLAIPFLVYIYLFYFIQNIFGMDLNVPNPAAEILPSIFILIVLSILASASSLYLYYYTAKALKTAMKKHRVKFGTFVGEFAMLLFWYIGIWMIQPDINKLIESELNPELMEDDSNFENYDN